ncbi:MAG: hypothetical protein Q8R48_08410 [Candidatus Omnitrophota bacterium]|nr:hypothetical protein [Candidatus Omnitrophota bacterium]
MKILLNILLLLAIVAVIYGIWVVQPLPYDDWRVGRPYTLYIEHPLPETGQEIRGYFSSWYFLPSNPFSFFRAWSLIAAVVVVGLLWALLINEHVLTRAGLTMLALLGFPYLGHVGPWHVTASMYTTSVIWMIAWYAAFRKILHAETQPASKIVSLFILTFIAASWHEVWLVTFSGIIIYLTFDVFSSSKGKDRNFKLKMATIYLAVMSAYLLALAFYTRGGINKFINTRITDPNYSALLFNWQHLARALVLGTKECLVLFKDSLPIFLLIIYAKLNKNFKSRLSSDFKLFLSAALGSILFMYVGTFVVGTPPWRTRWLCVLSLSVALFAAPKSILIDRLSFRKSASSIRVVRLLSIVAAVVWLSYNAYFTYAYTNIDVAAWLKYRQLVLDRDPGAMKKLGACNLPKGRPRGAAFWDHAWGAQDDRYRIFLGPSDDLLHAAVNTFWDQNKKKD